MSPPNPRVPTPGPEMLRLAATTLASVNAARAVLAHWIPSLELPYTQRALDHLVDWLVQEAEDRERPAPKIVVTRVGGT